MKTKADEQVMLAHGGGGELTHRLLKEHILPLLRNPLLDPLNDSAILPPMKGRLCMTTDAFVVQPLEFSGGDIGRLAVCGTVNDLSVMGARPVCLSLALVIEEGLPIDRLQRIMQSISSASLEADVPVATGDTKVIERRGKGDNLFITTAGVGELPDALDLGMDQIRAGDAIIISGLIADHGLAVMAAREGLSIRSDLKSDAAPLNHLIETLLAKSDSIRFMRDPTRGGLAGVLADLVEGTGLSLEVHESALPVSRMARHAAELLGLDPLTVANEGKVVIVVAQEDADKVVEACRAHALGKNAAKIGSFMKKEPPLAELITEIGGRRIIQRPYGEELPRIC
ncbi:MAG: hydrogenase expression/formation protein HypE [Planctomycetota bacterium]